MEFISIPEGFIRKSDALDAQTLFIAFVADKYTKDSFCCLYLDKAYFAWNNNKIRVDLNITPDSRIHISKYNMRDPFDNTRSSSFYFNTNPEGVSGLQRAIDTFLTIDE